MEYPNCSVGELTDNECHKLSHGCKRGIKTIESLSEEERVLLKLRADVEVETLKTICLYHKTFFLN